MPDTPSTDTTTPTPWVQLKQRTEHADLIAYLFKPPPPALQYVQASPSLAMQFVRLISTYSTTRHLRPLTVQGWRMFSRVHPLPLPVVQGGSRLRAAY